MQKKSKIILMSFCFFLFAFCTVGHAAEKRYSIPIGHSPQFGPENANVTIIEFVDFQ